MPEPINPIFKKWIPELGERQWGLTDSDFRRVQAGYACGVCLEPFVSWVPRCYVCGAENVPAFLDAPSEWAKQGE